MLCYLITIHNSLFCVKLSTVVAVRLTRLLCVHVIRHCLHMVCSALDARISILFSSFFFAQTLSWQQKHSSYFGFNAEFFNWLRKAFCACLGGGQAMFVPATTIQDV